MGQARLADWHAGGRTERSGLPMALAPLAGVLPEAVLRQAAARAAQLGVGADEVLIAARWITAEVYAQRAAAWLGLAYDRLDHVDAAAAEAPDVEAIRAGFVAIGRSAAGLQLAVAVHGGMIGPLRDLLARSPELVDRIRLTSPGRLRGYVLRRSGPALAQAAAFGLARERPDLSAAARPPRRRVPAWAVVVAILAALVAAPTAVLAVLHVALSTAFLAWTVLRVLSLFHADTGGAAATPIGDADLPRYTVIVPLYREAGMVPGLVAALGRLDYPVEKLDIKVVVEADDRATRAALAAAGLPPHYDVIVAPQLGPHTKPKALCAALPFVRGRYVVVYDAEDRPDPGQLRAALAAFRRGGASVGCVQARLAIDNARDGWLTRHFAAEYAGLFDVLLPMLVRLGLPIPLGGTSNHFRLDALRIVGAWDPFNVTEDADLGMRLARFDWRTTMIDSTTLEEAPRHWPAWLRQRTRWFKGWVQTWLVHMRAPGVLYEDLGPWGFVVFQLMVGGTVLAALVHPLFLALLAGQIATGQAFATGGVVGAFLAGLSGVTLVCGYAASAAIGLSGLARRRLLSLAWVLVTMPVYWLLLSVAAWRAVWQFARDPFRWEKTDHGFARTSLAAPASAPVARARLLTDIGAGRRPPPRASASG